MFWDAWFRKRRWERRLASELHFHMEEQVKEYVAAGLTPEQARIEAFREFGSIELAKEECRDQRPLVWLDQTIQDVRHTARLLLRDRAFSIVAILSLAAGIGASASVFSVVDRILFRSMPYAYSDRLVSVGVGAPMLPYDFMFGAAYLDFRTHQRVFDAVTSWSGVSECDLMDGEAVALDCAAAESTFLSTLGIRPILGRGFTRDEDGPNKPAAVLLSYAMWQSRFGGQRDVLGRVISVNGKPARVVGVLPADFETPTLAHADLLIPQVSDDATLQRAVTGRPLRVIARLRPRQSFEQARAAGQALVAAGLRNVPPEMAKEIKPRVQSLRDLQVGDARLVSWILFGSVLAVLLLSCANVSNLLLARTVARRREQALRAPLWAPHGRDWSARRLQKASYWHSLVAPRAALWRTRF